MADWLRVVVVLVSILVALPAAAQPPSPEADAWWRVDALAPGTRVDVVLESGERHTGWFVSATPAAITIAVGKSIEVPDEKLSWSKSRIRKVRRATDWRFTEAGSLIGGAAIIGLVQAGSAACGIGCENDMPVGAGIASAAIGAGLGGLAGFVADRAGASRDVLYPASVRNADWGSYLSIRGGPIFSGLTTLSSDVTGSARGGGVAAAVQLSRMVSVHGEYAAMRGLLSARPGAIDPEVLANVVPAASRSAGWSRGVEQVRVNAMFSEMIGIHPWTWSRVRVELLGGVAVQASETFSYYDAGPGTYKVLNFASPDLGAVLGANAEIMVVRHLAVVPMIRYYAGHSSGPSMSYAVGAQYRF